MENKSYTNAAGAKKEFLRIFRQMSQRLSSWNLWCDLMTIFACSLSNPLDTNIERRNRRDKEHTDAVERVGEYEPVIRMMECLIDAFEMDPNQDFLGTIYQELNLSNKWNGQFFTPYSVCGLMAQLHRDSIIHTAQEKGFASVCDNACGAGALLIAAANAVKEAGHNYQQDVLFVGQDIDPVAVKMCYIQLSLLGCSGYICCADSLANPVVGNGLIPFEQEGQDFWYTPMWYRDDWQLLRMKNVPRGAKENV